MFPGSQLSHTAGIFFTFFPRTGGALRKCSVGSGVVCSIHSRNNPAGHLLSVVVWLEEMLCLPWDLAQSLKEDFSCNLQCVLSYANIDETPSGLCTNMTIRVWCEAKVVITTTLTTEELPSSI